ncbi:MAG: ABC transporter permease [Trebonia sp.]|jgi:ABC-2 type transport system permease protein
MSRVVTLAARQALMEQRTFWRSAEYALFTFALPLALLLLIGSTTASGDLPGTDVEGQMIFVPSIIAFGVIVAAYVNLGAKLATLRHDGVLKRIRTTPLPASAYLSGVLGSTAATTLAITACIMAIGAIVFHAVPRTSGLPEIAGGLILGVICFGSLGVALSSLARSAESAGPIANASYLPIAIMSGIFDPTFSVPGWLSAVVAVLPVRALAQILEQGYTPVEHAPITDLFVLLAWTAIGCALAAWRFRWH